MEIDYSNLDKLLNDIDYKLFKRDIGRYNILEYLDTQVGYDYLLDGWLKQLEKRTGNKSRNSALFFTPIKIANDMLDFLPEDTWSNPDIKILSLCDKNGVFLYLAYLRFMVGLAEKIPNVKARRGHILTLQLYSIAADEKLGDELAFLYTGYYNKDLANILTVGEYDDYIESIRTGKIKKSLMEEFNTMKFDIVVGNPPYNNDIYLDFVTLGDSLSSKYTLMITPAKWQAKGGQKNEAFRQNIVPRMSDIVYYPNSQDVFDISERGGISCYLIDKHKHSIKNITDIDLEHKYLCSDKEIRNWENVHCIHNSNVNIILDKVLPCVQLNKNISKHKFKVFTSLMVCSAQKDSLYPKDGLLLVLNPMSIIEDSDFYKSSNYKVVYSSDIIDECKSFISYVGTKFIRFLIYCGICGNSVTTAECWRFVPDPGAFDHIFTDDELYKKYSLTQEEISLIESVIKERK